jgi:hypothetical protein
MPAWLLAATYTLRSWLPLQARPHHARLNAGLPALRHLRHVFRMLVHHLALLGGGLFSCAVGNDLAVAREFTVARCAAQPLIMLLYTNEFNSLFMLNRVSI